MNVLSVILISKNQAWNIARLIESVLTETQWLNDCEVILVDSASTDDTVHIATRYPIRIIQLSKEQFLCPSAGRYIGYQNTSSDYVLFLDGDNELYPGWLKSAIGILESKQDIAGVTGSCIVLAEDSSDADKPAMVVNHAGDHFSVNHAGGEALYRRSVLDEVGSFNPFLYSDEEPELALRIRYAGYKLVQTEYPISYDYTPQEELISTKIKRWRRNLYLGAGQNLRYLLGTERFWAYVRERGFGLIPLAALLAGLILLLLSIVLGQPVWIALWCSALFGLIAIDTLRKRSLYFSTASFIQRLAVADGTLRGFFIPPSEPHLYESKHIVIK